MFTSKHRATLAAISASIALTAAACGSTSASKTSSSSGAVTNLTMLTGFTGPDAPWYKSLIANFNKTHPKIHVTMTIEPWASIAQKLPEAWAAGQGPDLATPNSDPSSIFPYLKTNSVLPLNSAVGSKSTQINTASFPAAVRSAFTVKGTVYAVPANLATLALYYNKQMFAAAGIAHAPKTESAFIADAKKLTITKGGSTSQYGLSLADHNTIQMWPILMWMSGGRLVNTNGCAAVNDSASVAALKEWSSLVVRNHISPIGQSGSSADTLFAAKKAAMEINGPWAAPGYRKVGINLGIAPLPVGSAGPVTLLSTVPLMIERKTAHPSQAKTFLAWWTGKTAQTEFVKSSDYPPVRTDLQNLVATNATVSVFADSLKYARVYLPSLPSATQIDSSVFDPLIEGITRGGNVSTLTASAARQINVLTGCKSGG